MNPQPQRLTVEEMCRKLKPFFGEKIDRIYAQYSISNSIEEKNEILQALTLLYQKNLNKLLDKSLLLEPPKQGEITGEYPLGNIVYANKELYSFGLNENDWPRHVCITGMSGSGKTNFAFNILENFIGKDKPFLVFDWKKSFRSLINVDPSLMIFTIGHDSVSNLFKTNINVPPKGVSPKEWINVLADLLTESFSASFGVHKVLLETLDEIFEGWDIYKLPEQKRHYPNWMHIKKMLEGKARDARGRESEWFESALRIASILTFGDFGKVINYEGKKSLSVEDLFDKRVVFELNSLGNIEKKFFCEFILTYIYKHKKTSQNRINESFNYAILVDEAHNVFLKDKTNFVSESITDMAYREMREYGISLICLDQHISKLSDTVKGNSACHIAFQQQLPQDIYDISSITQLHKQRDSFSQLPVGSAIVKLSERYNQPFLVRTPFISLREQEIPDEKVSSRMDAIIKGIEVEKEDSEFRDSITFERESESGKWNTKSLKNPENPETSLENHSHETPEISEITQENEIPETSEDYKTDSEYDPEYAQGVLYSFVKEELAKGHDLKNIERVLESGVGLDKNGYTSEDVLTVMNQVLNEQLNQPEQSQIRLSEQNTLDEIQENQSRLDQAFLDNFEDEEKMFLSFLMEFPNHDYSTVELYRNMGFSARKGNVLKNKLLEKGIIKVQEQKSKTGWKKFIRLANINTPNIPNTITNTQPQSCLSNKLNNQTKTQENFN